MFSALPSSASAAKASASPAHAFLVQFAVDFPVSWFHPTYADMGVKIGRIQCGGISEIRRDAPLVAADELTARAVIPQCSLHSSSNANHCSSVVSSLVADDTSLSGAATHDSHLCRLLLFIRHGHFGPAFSDRSAPWDSQLVSCRAQEYCCPGCGHTHTLARSSWVSHGHKASLC